MYNKELLVIVALLKIYKVYKKKILKLNIYITYKNFLYFATIK